jgi:4-hydroxy 2-oxovalerate aldolase
MNFIDVTLRDGGHQNGFNWDKQFVLKYLELTSQCASIPDYVELGYWKQHGKYDGAYYKCDEQMLGEYNSLFPNLRFSVMLDFHYCSTDLRDYPESNSSSSPAMIRLCSRSEDIEQAAIFGASLKKHTGCALSINFFNITNYTLSDIDKAVKMAIAADADYIYFADTHGTLDLDSEREKYGNYAKMISSSGIKAGLHLHDHSGKAYMNFRALESCGFESTDFSFCGVGKGMGNLRLEFVKKPDEILPLLTLMSELEQSISMPSGPWGLMTANSSTADHYAVEAAKHNLDVFTFVSFLKSLNDKDRDVYDARLLGAFIK